MDRRFALAALAAVLLPACPKEQTQDLDASVLYKDASDCVPDCGARRCGDDGCGQACGYCAAGFTCQNDQCAPCTRNCVNRDCGPDGCAGSCGSCSGTCTAGRCLAADAGTPDASADGGSDGGNHVTCTPQPPQYTTSFTLAGVCEAVAKAECDRLVDCCLFPPAVYDRCLADVAGGCHVQEIPERIAAGLISVDLPSLKTCLAKEIARVDCGEMFLSIGCDPSGLIQGAAGPAGTCLFPQDCSVPGLCTRQAGQCNGVCGTYIATGGPCNDVDLLCDPAASFCVRAAGAQFGVCTAFLQAGAACASGTCDPASLFCTGSPATCTALKAAAATCGPADWCARGYSCTGTCRLELTQPVGAQCSSDQSCNPSAWCSGASSTAFGHCTAFLPLGAGCSTSFSCGPGARCGQGLCVARGAEGQGCTTALDCQGFLRCAAGTCTAQQATVGDACSLATDCASGWCDTSQSPSTCKAPMTAGSQCALNASCGSSACEGFVNGVGTCRPVCPL